MAGLQACRSGEQANGQQLGSLTPGAIRVLQIPTPSCLGIHTCSSGRYEAPHGGLLWGPSAGGRLQRVAAAPGRWRRWSTWSCRPG